METIYTMRPARPHGTWQQGPTLVQCTHSLTHSPFTLLAAATTVEKDSFVDHLLLAQRGPNQSIMHAHTDKLRVIYITMTDFFFFFFTRNQACVSKLTRLYSTSEVEMAANTAERLQCTERILTLEARQSDRAVPGVHLSCCG